MKQYTPLFEKDNRQTIIKIFNLPEFVVNHFHRLSDKWSLVLCNWFMEETYVKYPHEVEQINLLEVGLGKKLFRCNLKTVISICKDKEKLYNIWIILFGKTK